MFSTILLVIFCVLMSILIIVNIGVLYALIKVVRGFADMSTVLQPNADLLKALDIFQ